MVTPSDLRQPVGDYQRFYCLWLTPSVVTLFTLHSVVRVKHHRVRQNLSWGQGYCFPSGYCYLEVRQVVSLCKMAATVGG